MKKSNASPAPEVAATGDCIHDFGRDNCPRTQAECNAKCVYVKVTNPVDNPPVSGVAAPTGGSEAELPFKLPLEFRPHRPLYVSGAITDADGYIIADDALKAKADLLISYVNSFAKLEGELAALKAALIEIRDSTFPNSTQYCKDVAAAALGEKTDH